MCEFDFSNYSPVILAFTLPFTHITSVILVSYLPYNLSLRIDRSPFLRIPGWEIPDKLGRFRLGHNLQSSPVVERSGWLVLNNPLLVFFEFEYVIIYERINYNKEDIIYFFLSKAENRTVCRSSFSTM